MVIPAAWRVPPPAEGWPAAPCPKWREAHPAHGWVGPKSGRLYWCGPKARAWAHAVHLYVQRNPIRSPEEKP